MADDDDDAPMPGQNEFSAPEEWQMRQARAAANQASQSAPSGPVNPNWDKMRPSTNIEDVRNKGSVQKTAEWIGRKPYPKLAGY